MEIEKRPNGSYRVRVWDQSLGKKINVGTFATRAAARTEGAKAELRLKTDGFIEPRKDVTFGQLCDRFIETNNHLCPTTLAWYGYALKHARKYFGENESTRRIAKEDVHKYVASMTKAKKAGKTINGYNKALHAVFEQAIDWKYRDDNPAHKVRNLPANKRASDAIRILTPIEHQRIIEAAPATYRVMFSIWPFIGLRRSEMQGLTWDDIDLNAKRLSVRFQLREDGRLDTNLKTPKSTRSVDLTVRVVRELRAWRLECKPTELNLVFPTPRGLPQSSKAQFYKVWNKTCAAVGIAGCSSHDMRHTYATWSLAAGENPKRVADQLGHEKPSITLDTYAHLLPEPTEKAESKLESWFAEQHIGDGHERSTAPILPQAVGNRG